jgi:hypothetical protein
MPVTDAPQPTTVDVFGLCADARASAVVASIVLGRSLARDGDVEDVVTELAVAVNAVAVAIMHPLSPAAEADVRATCATVSQALRAAALALPPRTLDAPADVAGAAALDAAVFGDEVPLGAVAGALELLFLDVFDTALAF